MSKQYLIPVKDLEDATEALARLPSVAEPGDEAVVLFVSPLPAAELIGSRPPATVMDPLATTGGVSSEPRAADDRPQFIGREEIMELKGRELCEALNPQLASLHDRGYEARADAVFSDEPGPTIRDYAGDLDVNAVFTTPAFNEELDEETRAAVRSL